MERIETNEVYTGAGSNASVLENNVNLTYVSAVSGILGHFIGDDSEDPIYPISNITDLHPQKVMRALTDNIVISIPFNGYTNSVAIFNTNASSAIVVLVNATVDDPVYADGEEISSELLDLQGANTYLQFISDRGKKEQEEFYVTYEHRTTPHVLNIYLSGPVDGTGKIEAGVVFVGENTVTQDPLYGITQTSKDYSIVSELANGATYTLKRPLVRVFGFDLDFCEPGGDFYDLQRTFDNIGPDPIPWLITKGTQEKWLVFARKNSEQSGNFYAYNRVRSSINLIEVL